MKALSFGLAALLTVSTSQAAVYTLSGTMDVFQATTNPGNVGNGSGTISGSYDDVSNLLDYTITFSGLSGTPSNMHFHVGAPGVGGGVALGIPGPYTTGSVSASGVAVASDTDLLAGNWYVNVHTGDFGGGEIRGQVNVAPVPEPTAPLLLLGSLGALALHRRRA